MINFVCVLHNYIKPLAISDFKPKRGDTRLTQGRVTPVVGDHKVDHGYAPRSSSMFSSSAKPWHSSDIKFYHQYEPYYEFTNFSQYPIQLDGKQWPTTEHYFQAQKFIGTPYEEAIRKQPNARGAFDMSRNPSVSHWRRGDWDRVKDDVMLKCLRAKFTQHKDLREKLLDTGERHLIEHTSNDSYWGDGGDGSGQNKLGKLLMRVRKEISKQIHECQGKYMYKSSLDYESLGRNDRENKHRRHNSISGITPSVSVSSSIGSQSTLMSSKRKYRSTENLHHAAYSAKKDTPSSSYTLGRTKQQQHGALVASENRTQYKPTIKRSGSLNDLQHKSSIYHRDIFGKYMPKANQSSVNYNIISHQ